MAGAEFSIAPNLNERVIRTAHRYGKVAFPFDSHLDLGMNAVLMNRDLTRTVAELRSCEVGMPEPGRALGTVTFPAMRKGEVALAMEGADPIITPDQIDVPAQRQFSDEQVKAIIARDGVIGVACDAWMLYPNWERGKTSNSVVTMAAVADHVDHICQIAGNANHVAIGTDRDGGYGYEQTPNALHTIADLPKLLEILRSRGYTESQVTQVAHGNWLRRLETAWC